MRIDANMQIKFSNIYLYRRLIP